MTRDLDLHGLLRLRLIGATPRDVAEVERRLGVRSTPGPAPGDADMTITWDDPPTMAGPRRLVGSSGSWADGWFRLAHAGRPRAPGALIPFDRIGSPIEVLVERGARSVPFLTSLVNATLLGRGVLPLHASAFNLLGLGIAAAGWSQSGKTEALLAVAGRGATVVSDEWTLVTPDGVAHGLASPVRLEAWHLRARPDLAARVPLGERARVRRAAAMDGLSRRAPGRLAGRLPVARPISFLGRLVGPPHVDVGPEVLFGPGGTRPETVLDRILWMVPTDSDRIVIEPADPSDVATRMALAHVHHRRALIEAYWSFRYAFPERMSPLLEAIEDRERSLLTPILGRLPVLRVELPRPVDLDGLRDAIVSMLEREVR